ncbi:MAG: 30S ribosomal protein S27e [Candidatus Diapherotrites archaeon]|nr:30S ribosomal protein S27e [Candidatus Diapherotrites archaeon]
MRIPMPRSKFLVVKCPKCGNEQVVFNKAAIVVRCNTCGEIIARPTGSKAEILGKVVESLT